MAIRLVVSTSKGAGENGGVTDNIDTSLCNFLAVAVSGQFSATNYAVLSDSYSNVWVSLTVCGDNFTTTQWFYSVNPTVGTGHAFTFGNITSGAGTYPGCIVAGFSGVDTTSPFDQQGTNLGNANVTDSLTPSEDNCLVLTSFNSFTTDPTGVSSPFGIIALMPLTGGIKYASGAAYVVQTTATPAQATWAPSGRTSVDIAVFKTGPTVVQANIDAIPAPSTAAFLAPDVFASPEPSAATATFLAPVVYGVQLTSGGPAAYPIIYDNDFSGYPVGTFPPYGNLADYYAGGFGPIVDNSFPGIYGDAHLVDLRGDKLQFPILPDLNLEQVLSGKTYVSLGVPTYQQFSVFQGFRVATNSDLQNTILTFNSNLHPFSGAQVAYIHINSDGTISINGQGVQGPCSDYSLLIQQWYWMQVNIAFFTAVGGNVAFTCEVAINGLSVVSGTLVTSITTLPAYWINNIITGPALIGRLTITDVIHPIGDNPHPALSPVVAKVTQGVIELILAPQGVYSYAKMKGPAGVSFTS